MKSEQKEILLAELKQPLLDVLDDDDGLDHKHTESSDEKTPKNKAQQHEINGLRLKRILRQIQGRPYTGLGIGLFKRLIYLPQNRPYLRDLLKYPLSAMGAGLLFDITAITLLCIPKKNDGSNEVYGDPLNIAALVLAGFGGVAMGSSLLMFRFVRTGPTLPDIDNALNILSDEDVLFLRNVDILKFIETEITYQELRRRIETRIRNQVLERSLRKALFASPAVRETLPPVLTDLIAQYAAPNEKEEEAPSKEEEVRLDIKPS